MVSNFKSSGVDLNNIFALRSWFSTGNQLWAWGYRASLANNDLINRSSPVQIGAVTGWKSIESAIIGNNNNDTSTLAITRDGTLWAWGNNNSGKLGLNNTISRSSPIQVGTDANWKQACPTPSHSLAVKTDGTLWSWGFAGFGRLGLGDIISRSSPVQVGTSTDWSSVSGSSVHSMALKTGGTLWTWGWGLGGALGHSSTINRSSPTQVGTDTNWAFVGTAGGDHTNIVSSIEFPCHHSFAIKTTGSLWAWGINDAVMGLNDTAIPRSSPVQIGTSTDWKVISGSSYSTGTPEPPQRQRRRVIAIKTDGTMWAWGANATGALGLNDAVNRSSPTQVGSLSNWSSLAPNSGAGYTVSRIKTDGTLWIWGSNTFGGLGLNSTTPRSSPVQIGSETSWVAVNSPHSSIIALKSTGTFI